MTRFFLDTPLLLACFDDRLPERQAQAQAWLRLAWQERAGRVSQQVLAEFYAQARLLFPSSPIAAGDARAEARRLQHWQPWAMDAATMETAWAVESRYGLPFAEAQVVACAQAQDCEVLLSESLPDGLRIDQLWVMNPFLTSPGQWPEWRARRAAPQA